MGIDECIEVAETGADGVRLPYGFDRLLVGIRGFKGFDYVVVAERDGLYSWEAFNRELLDRELDFWAAAYADLDRDLREPVRIAFDD